MSDLKFLVVGCGAVGIPYTWVLAQSVPEANIFAVCRSNRDVAADKGLRMNSEVWGDNLQVKPIIVGSVAEAVERNNGQAFDYVIVSTKCLPPFSAMPECIRPAVEQGRTSIALFQNGIGIEDHYAKLYPENPIISVVVYVKTNEIEPGYVHHINIQHLHMGTYPASAPKAHKDAMNRLAALYKSGGASIDVHDDVQVERWSKALVNSVWNPVTALTRLGDAAFLAADSDAEGMIRDAMRETAAVAQACGFASVNDELVEFQLSRAMKRKFPGVVASMMVDAVSGRRMEIDALVGNIIEIGKQKGVPTPLLKMLYLLTKGLNESTVR